MAETEFKYDVFISYSHKDEEWVVDTFLSALENAGLKVCIDFRDFIPGKPSRYNMRDACKESKYTVLVMTPAWMASEWTSFEGLLTFLHDPANTCALSPSCLKNVTFLKTFRSSLTLTSCARTVKSLHGNNSSHRLANRMLQFPEHLSKNLNQNTRELASRTPLRNAAQLHRSPRRAEYAHRLAQLG